MTSVARLRSLVPLLLLALALPGCGGDGAPETRGTTGPTAGAAAGLDLVSPGRLTVCSDIPYPPFEFEQDGEFTGFDIELMRAVADRLGLGLEVTSIRFEPLKSGAAFAARRCDVAASAMTITEDREENLDFSQPYYEAEQSLLVALDGGVDALDGTSGRTIGVQSGTTGEAYAEEHAPEDATIRRFGDAGSLFAALEARRVHGALQDLPVNVEYARAHDDVEVIETYATDEQYGFAVREEGSEALLEAIDGALEALRADGTYDELHDRYFGT